MKSILTIGPVERAALLDLRERAAAYPFDVTEFATLMSSRERLADHMKHLHEQSITVPMGYGVTFSVERGHSGGRVARHLSMVSPRADEGLMPSPEALWMVAEELGFTGSIDDCIIYSENRSDDGPGKAVNVVQIFSDC